MNKDGVQKVGTCVYCGKSGPVTDDHTPPDCLFPKPKPSNLITVPACRECHAPWSKEDEYFLLKVGFNQAIKDHPAAKANLAKIIRALHRPQARGFSQMYRDDLVHLNLMANHGIFVEQRLAYNVDLKRIFGVVERIVRGLFYHETGHRLPDTHSILTVNADTLLQNGTQTAQHILNTIVAPLLTLAPKTLGDNVFAYRHQFVEPPVSAWHLTFYGRVPFICTIAEVKAEKKYHKE